MTKRQNLRGYCLFSAIGWLFLFCCRTEKELAESGNIIWDGHFLLRLSFVCLTAGTLLGCAVFFLLSLLRERIASRRASHETVTGAAGFSPRRGTVFLFSWLLITLCRLPIYFAYYPAICSYDTTIQMGQIFGGPYNDHHPLLHTLMLRAFMALGGLISDRNLGIGLYALFQILLSSAVFSAGILLIYEYASGRLWAAAALLYCCLFPFHAYMSVSVTKDAIFCSFFLALSLFLWLILRQGRNCWKPGAADGLYVLSALGMTLFRSNGIYILLVLAAVLPFSLFPKSNKRKLLLRLTVETAASLIAGELLLTGIFALSHAEQGDRREMLSLPIQQLARTYVYHGGTGLVPDGDDTLPDQDRALINDFILEQAYLQYRPDISDPVKRYTNTYVARYRTKEFLNTYLGLFLRYPGDYLNAALAVNAGYLYPNDTSHALINVNGKDRGLGYIQTRWVDQDLNAWGIYKASKWEWLHEKLEDFADRNAYLRIPLLKYVMVPGVYLWFWLLLAAWLWARRRYVSLLPLVPVFGCYFTLFLGPTVQMRYLYPLMITLPFIGILTLSQKTVKEDTSCKSQKAPGFTA